MYLDSKNNFRHVQNESDYITLQRKLKEKDQIINDLMECLRRAENEIKKLQKQIGLKSSVSTKQIKDEIAKALPMLTPNQLSLMTGEKKRVNWTSEEISRGFAHSYFSRSGYNYGIHKMKIPQPSVRTLQKWGEKLPIEPGMLEGCFVVLKALRETLTDGESQVRIYVHMTSYSHCKIGYQPSLRFLLFKNPQLPFEFYV